MPPSLRPERKSLLFSRGPASNGTWLLRLGIGGRLFSSMYSDICIQPCLGSARGPIRRVPRLSGLSRTEWGPLVPRSKRQRWVHRIISAVQCPVHHNTIQNVISTPFDGLGPTRHWLKKIANDLYVMPAVSAAMKSKSSKVYLFCFVSQHLECIQLIEGQVGRDLWQALLFPLDCDDCLYL